MKIDSPRLAAIALKAKLHVFVDVKKAIEDMVTQLLAEKRDEINHKDFCVEDVNTSQLQTILLYAMCKLLRNGHQIRHIGGYVVNKTWLQRRFWIVQFQKLCNMCRVLKLICKLLHDASILGFVVKAQKRISLCLPIV